MFYGWGQDSVEFPMPDGRTAVCVYKYFSLMFIFKLARSQRWYIVDQRAVAGQAPGRLSDGAFGEGPAPAQPDVREVTKDEVAAAFSPEDPPQLSLWRRYGLLFPVLGVAIVIGLAMWSTRGTSSVATMEAGDCFQQSTEAEIDRLETPDCSEAHDSQIIDVVDLEETMGSALPAVMPADNDAFWDEVYQQCLDAADVSITRMDELPDDALVSFLSPTIEGWTAGDKEVVCFLHSPDGLEGSFILSE